MDYIIFTDGACAISTKQGGIGIVVLRNSKFLLEYSKPFINTTNNQMELIAVIAGLRMIKQPINSLTIISDSMYVIGCASLGWKPKKNKELWEIFNKEFKRVQKLCNIIEFKHTRGHQHDESENTKWNNRCDKLANTASTCLL